MADADRLPKTILRILHGRASSVASDDEGWVQVEDVRSAAEQILRRSIGSAQVASASTQLGQVELRGSRMRVAARRSRFAGRGAPQGSPRRGSSPQSPRRNPQGVFVPDVLFHATTTEHILRAREAGVLAGARGRPLYLSDDESTAWRAAHRLSGIPQVLPIDAFRARRDGVQFARPRPGGPFTVQALALRHLLSLRPGFDYQLSAGGIPVRHSPRGALQLALIRVERRSGSTWEVAKGKLEPGETPEAAAAREVCEELGIQVPLRVLRPIADLRYAFYVPQVGPRLKTVYLYLLRADAPIEDFVPAEGEGVAEVRWFDVDAAVRAVTHRSLQPAMRRARQLLERHGLTSSAP